MIRAIAGSLPPTITHFRAADLFLEHLRKSATDGVVMDWEIDPDRFDAILVAELWKSLVRLRRWQRDQIAFLAFEKLRSDGRIHRLPHVAGWRLA